MAKMVNWNVEGFQRECFDVSMDRLEEGAKLIRDEMKQILRSQLKGNWMEHEPYETGEYKGEPWTERRKGAMVDTIRVRRKKGDSTRNIWILAGNFKTWWAVQMEYGRGEWRGGKKSFMRPAMAKASSLIKGVLESGAGQTREELWEKVNP